MTTLDSLMAELDALHAEGGEAFDDHVADHLEQLSGTLAEDDLETARQAVLARLPDRGVHAPLHFLLAKLVARQGERRAAGEIVGRIVERLNQEGQYAVVVQLLTRVIELAPREAAVPMLIRAYRETEGSAVTLELVQEWLEQFPGDRRLLWLQGRLELAAGLSQAPAHLAEVLASRVREEPPEALEEDVLPVIETLDADTAPYVTDMLQELLRAKRFEEVTTYLDLCLDFLLDLDQAEPLWSILSSALAADREAKRLRPSAVRALERHHRGDEHIGQMIERAGLGDRATPFADALRRYKGLTRFPIGGYVEHSSWGIGEVLDASDEMLMIRFAGRPAHEMKRSLAERALDRLEPDDLRVMVAFAPERVAELRESDPGALIAGALRTLGGTGKPRDLRRVLTETTMEVGDWAAWWKRTRALLEDDERFDLSETFQDVYKLADAGGDTEAVLRIDDKHEPTRQIKLLRRFLAQHPRARDRTISAYSRRLERWLQHRRMTTAERILVRLVLRDWHPEREPELVEELVSACEAGFDLSEITAPEDQELLLELGLRDRRWRPVALAGLASKLHPIRERARAAIEASLSEEEARQLYATLLEQSPQRGDAVLEVVHGYLEQHTHALARQSIVDVFLGLLALISEPEREALRNRALKLLAADGPVFGRLAATAPPERTDIERVAVALLAFRASDRFLNPILDALERVWGSEPLDALRRRRERESAKIAARMDDDSGFPTVLYMTRSTYDALVTEIERVDRELRTTIPRAIQKARELGDLRENAEYESAKLKQRQYDERLALLSDRLAQAAIIEEAQVDGSEVFVGTEVVLEDLDQGGQFAVWVLGYDDSHHADHVVSFQSDVGRALWRRRVGAELELPGEETTRRVRVKEIQVRMPETVGQGAGPDSGS